MSTSEASKNGKKPTSVGPPEGSGGSHSSRLENHNESFGDHKPEGKSSKNKNKVIPDVQPGGSRGSNSDADNRGRSSSSEGKHDGSVSDDTQEADTYGPCVDNAEDIRKIEFSESTIEEGSKYISWIAFYYDDDVKTPCSKGNDVAITRTIKFPKSDEVLKDISGCYEPLPGKNKKTDVIWSLTFHTTKTNYGPYGHIKDVVAKTSLLRFPPANEKVEGGGKVVGIRGRKSINLYVMKIQRKQNIGNAQPPAANQVNEPPSCGSWGGGTFWNDGSFSGIKQIKLKRAPKGIASIKIEYAVENPDEGTVWMNNHGKFESTRGDKEKTIDLVPNEKLTHISGTFGSISKEDQRIIIKSLTFHSNLKPPHGPYAGTDADEEVAAEKVADEEVAAGNSFETSHHSNKVVVGFYGRSNDYLVDIGVHMGPDEPGLLQAIKSSLSNLI